MENYTKIGNKTKTGIQKLSTQSVYWKMTE